jgi:hypothetical protein
MKYPSHLGRARTRRLHALLALNDSLRFLSAYIPGGVFTTIALARMSSDEKVRQVAFAWNALPRKEHKTVNLDQLCLNAGLTPGSVIQNIQTLLAEQLPRDEIPRHAEAALFSGKRRDVAALYPVHLVERYGGDSSDGRVGKLKYTPFTSRYRYQTMSRSIQLMRPLRFPLMVSASYSGERALMGGDIFGSVISTPSRSGLCQVQKVLIFFFGRPTGRFVGFFALALSKPEIKKFDLTTGLTHTVCNLSTTQVSGGTWSQDGVILFSQPSSLAKRTEGGSILYRVLASGGEARPFLALDSARRELSQTEPQFLPDSQHFLYQSIAGNPELKECHLFRIIELQRDQGAAVHPFLLRCTWFFAV